MAETKPNLGALIDKLFEIREQIRALNAQADKLSEAKISVELNLLAEMKKQGIEQSRGARASATVSKSIVPQAEDWDKIYGFVMKYKMPYLFEKRIGVKTYQELLATRNNKPIPGIKSFEKQTISLRTN